MDLRDIMLCEKSQAHKKVQTIWFNSYEILEKAR